jgi:hypothetical protein
MDPKKNIKANLLNNLAVAYWWHKLPNHEYMGNEDNTKVNAEYSKEDLEKEFNTVIAMCKRSIEVIETNLPEFSTYDIEFRKKFVELVDGTNVVPENIEVF